MADIDQHESVAVAKGNFNVGGVIAAIAFLILVLGVLKYFGVLPF